MSDAEWVTVRGTVYKRVIASRGRGEYVWLRRSVPPDAWPGKRSKWPPSYRDGKLPAHEVITAERANEICESSLGRLDDVRAAHGIATSEDR